MLFRTAVLVCFSLTLAAGSLAEGALPTVEQALGLRPTQKDVNYDTPAAKEIPDCSIKSEDVGGGSALIVRGPAGQLLRSFVDTNGDNRVDQWRYYQSGIESFRDVDSDFNGKADEYRWLGLSGIRWGLDKNEDGKVDTWKLISAEEVTQEIAYAIRDRDADRFNAVLLTANELRGLGLNDTRQAELAKSIATAEQRFAQAVRSQKIVDAKSEWLHFGASRPGTLPEGTDGSEKDVTVYENVVAMLETEGQHGQLSVGTLVQVGDTWKAVDVPISLMGDQESLAASSYILQPAQPAPQVPEVPQDAIDPAMEKLAAEMQKVEVELQKASTPAQFEQLYERQAATLEEMARKSSSRDEQATWIKQLADTMNTAVQMDRYPAGITRLEKLAAQIAGQEGAEDLEAYVTWRLMSAQYATEVTAEGADIAELQKKWHEKYEKYVEQYPKAPDAQEAMLQLALNEEFALNDKGALEWYTRIVDVGGDTSAARIAKGARTRLTSDGKPISLGGKTVDNRSLSTSQLRGRIVLIHYWATWSEASLMDNKGIQELVKQYGQRGFQPVGITVDTDDTELGRYLSSAKLNWPQLHEEKGLDGTLAVELGIRTIPTMLLLDDKGNVVSRNVQLQELAEYLKKTLR